MARKSPGDPKAGSPLATDDFQRIRGIGPVVAGRLYRAGICTYHQLASLSAEELSKRSGGISMSLITRQDWISQAHKLEHHQIQSRHRFKKAPKNVLRQHYENFTIEFLLDEKKILRRLRAVHVQSGDADTWAGWEADQLIDFMARHSGAQPCRRKTEKKVGSLIPTPPASNVHIEPIAPPIRPPEHKLHSPEIPKIEQPSRMAVVPVLSSSESVGFADTLRLQDFCIFRFDSDTPAPTLYREQPCRVRLTLDLTSVDLVRATPLQYKAMVTFKQLGGTSYSVSEMSSFFEQSEHVTLEFRCTAPSAGLYRPEAFVKLLSGETTNGLMASIKGDLIQVV